MDFLLGGLGVGASIFIAVFLFKWLTGHEILWRTSLRNVFSEPFKKASKKIASREDNKIYRGEVAIARVITPPVTSDTIFVFPLLADVADLSESHTYHFKHNSLKYEGCAVSAALMPVISSTGGDTLFNVQKDARFVRVPHS
jgi:hypothetical protein